MKTKIRVTKTVTLGTKTLEEYKAAFEKQEKTGEQIGFVF
jgi:hypothetical protein